MYYPCSENKGADQLRGYREADLRLCFRLGKNPVFSRCGSDNVKLGLANMRLKFIVPINVKMPTVVGILTLLADKLQALVF